MPNQLATEKALIGAILQEPDRVIPFCIKKKLTKESFTDINMRNAYRGALYLTEQNQPIDSITLAALLKTESTWIASCLDNSEWPYAEAYIDILVKAQTKRKLMEFPAKITEAIRKEQPTQDVIQSTITDLQSIQSSDLSINHELPKIVDAESLTSESIQEPNQVIEGVLHRGSKAVFGGPSKAFKSWTLLDLCLAVSTGNDWLGFKTTPGKVLYINFELQKFAVTKRIKAIAESRDCEINKNFHVWNLRGFSRPLSQLIPELLKQIEGEEYSLIIPDPIYKTLSGRNENDAGDIGAVCNEIESMAVQTGAAVAFGAHFAKGNASGKEHIDRVSGSGVWSRDPDSIITATSHEMEGCFSVEMTLRNFPPPDPFVIRWEYPQMRRDDDLDPKALKQPRNGRTPEHSVSDILEHLSEPMTVSTWQKACKSESGISEASFYRRFKEAKFSHEVEKSGNLWHVVS
jgi:hypothetical protein